MFLYIGHDKSIPTKEIVGIFDAAIMQSEVTREFLCIAQDEGFAAKHNIDKIKSFVVANERVYFSATVPSTLRKRLKLAAKAPIYDDVID
ncbi:MAG TPA: DUF370 domain-containing protein [Firmicutes bacterium]|jgi:hypothetical protein|nr:DUF370 domain-containing protein [Bacillota bacterium]